MKFRHILTILAIAAVAATACHKDTSSDDTGGLKLTTASQWTIIGTIDGSDWNKDFAMKTDGTWHVAYNITLTATDKFKFRFNKVWDLNLGSASSAAAKVNEKLYLAPEGNNISVTAGTFDIYLSPENGIAYFLRAGDKFSHASDGNQVFGGDLGGDYSATLAPASKKSGITYQLNVYSFADSDGDGWGDFQGIIDHLDYLDAIGATALWLSPVNASQSYHAYDIKDYYAINPKYGGKNANEAQAEEKLRELCQEAAKKNIDIYIDYVLNHSGDQCNWFKQALAGNKAYRSYYVFSDDYTNDVENGLIDNFAGQTDPHMGGWHSAVVGSPQYTGTKNLHYKLDISTASAPKLTVTETDDAPQSEGDSGWYIYDNDPHQLRKTSDTIFEITLKFPSANNWGVLVKDHPTEWGTHKWGAPASDPRLIMGTPKTLVKEGENLVFGGDVTYFFGSFDKSMPDLNYGPYANCQNSAAFQDLAASADKWINLGVNGLRLDAVMWIYQCHTDANVKFLSEWYKHCNATYKARGGQGDIYMVGEAFDFSSDVVAQYYKGLPSLFDFPFYGTVKDRINSHRGSDLASTIKSIQDKNRNAYNSRLYTHTSGFYDAVKLSNHDEHRVASMLLNNDQKKRMAGAILLTSPGKPYIYQGEELGYWGMKSSGDQNVRQSIYWKKGEKVPQSWCAFDTAILTDGMSVAEQSANDRSLLQMYRHFAFARNTHSALAEGSIEPVTSGNAAVAAWKMVSSSETVLVMHNLGETEVTVTSAVSPDKVIVSSSNGEIKVSGTSVTLPAYSSVVFSVK